MKEACTTRPERTATAVVAIASSAGGLKALSALLHALPQDFPAPVLIVQHLDPGHRSLLADILGRLSRLPVLEAREGMPLNPGTVYIAPPDRHLLVGPDGVISLTHTETVHFVRPSADLLFESVAESYGPKAVAVVLTGTGIDGSDGIRAIKGHGGLVLAQDEATSEFFGMPGAAIRTGIVDHVLPLPRIADALMTLVRTGNLA